VGISSAGEADFRGPALMWMLESGYLLDAGAAL